MPAYRPSPTPEGLPGDRLPGDWYVQYADDAVSELEAEARLRELERWPDYCGGRVLPPGVAHASWRLQAFFEGAGVEIHDPLPDGCRLVWVPHALRGMLGFRDTTDTETTP